MRLERDHRRGLGRQLQWAAMEAAVRTERRIDSDKAKRIVDAMRASVGRRGAAASTFDHVAQEVGVSRGLLHYYFGTKERLLVEVVRRDSEIRLGILEERLTVAHSIDEIVDALVSQLKDFVAEQPGSQAVIYEMFSVSRRNDDIRGELAELYRKVRARVAELLRAKETEGVVRLRGDAEAVASILFALGDGLELQLVSDPSRDSSETFATGIATARFLLGA
jgi:AcrR family transcriptional regulator